MNWIERFKILPKSTKNLLITGVLLALVAALPLFVWGVVNQKFLITKKAASGEPTPTPKPIIDISGRPYLGPSDAPVTIVEFGDFQCPSCKTFHDQVFNDLLNSYPNQIKFVFKEFPLTSVHQQAHSAADAAECAFEQNKFWEMSNLLFSNQASLADSLYSQLAQQLSLSVNQFDQCMVIHRYDSTINNDYNQGISYGVTGTPTFFINGIIVAGAAPLSTFQDIINQELANINPTPPATTFPETTPTPSPGSNYCSGTNGSACSYFVCPVCTGQFCPAFPCTAQSGTCQNNQCVPTVPTPTATAAPNSYIHINSPNGGEYLTIGQHHTISWTGSGVNSYSLYLINSDGNSRLITTLPPSATSYDWVVGSPSYLLDPSFVGNWQFKVRVNDSGSINGAEDSSDSSFTMSYNKTRSFGILFKFDGVTDNSAEGAGVVVRFINSSSGNNSGYVTPPVTSTTYVGNGIYSMRFTLQESDLPTGNNYAIILKGEKHLGTKFCFPSLQSTRCAAGDPGHIAFTDDTSQLVSLNFTGIPLPAGDTPTQDGTVNSVDYQRILSIMAKSYSSQTNQDKFVADLNYDGVVNIKDIFLLRKTLETRYDEY